jgi:uncharacterized protein
MTLPPAAPSSAAVPAGPDGGDPSMEEILSSIRRILNEDEPAGGAAEDPREDSQSDDEVLVLDRSMLIAAPEVDPASTDAEQPAVATEVHEPALAAEAETADAEDAVHLASEPTEAQVRAVAEPVPDSPIPTMAVPEPPIIAPSAASILAEPPSESRLPPAQALVGPAAAAATATSVEGLIRALAASRTSQVYRGGPTIEDLVREELRVLLKGWLEDNLPQIVERLVRAEIEKLVGRAAP